MSEYGIIKLVSRLTRYYEGKAYKRRGIWVSPNVCTLVRLESFRRERK